MCTSRCTGTVRTRKAKICSCQADEEAVCSVCSEICPDRSRSLSGVCELLKILCAFKTQNPEGFPRLLRAQAFILHTSRVLCITKVSRRTIAAPARRSASGARCITIPSLPCPRKSITIPLLHHPSPRNPTKPLPCSAKQRCRICRESARHTLLVQHGGRRGPDRAGLGWAQTKICRPSLS